ncbi:Hypothetical_protein [Hexamita inflata]|uniref:Hypothetical_protein n=1 Tax=Hexamita inflata TaxID=28002 RepID=A0AA86Q9T5_9EUKA|nr:Hypothetical protein HINF_LOCUS42665 [Hexamita inflata]CAI9960646.1 Hypothetical protein HINF_LOCUS48291 [Hexamita inflata]
MNTLQTINVVKYYQLKIERGYHVRVSQVSMPLRSKPLRKIVSVQMIVRDKYTEPIVIARLLPNVQEQTDVFLEFEGPALVNFLVDCEDENDRFVHVVLNVQTKEEGEDVEEEEEGEEEDDDFELE